MKRVAILVAAIAFTLSINTKVFATDVQNLNSTQVNQTVVGTEGTQENTTSVEGEAVDSTNTDTNAPVEGTDSTSTDTSVNEVTNNDGGIMPDSIFYFFDKAFDNLRVFFTFDDEKKIEILSQIADERLAESESMTQAEKYDLAKSAIEEFNNLVTEASDKLNVLVEDNNNAISDQDKEIESTEVDLEHGEIKLDDAEGDKLGDLEKNILSKQIKSIEVLKKLSEKLDGNAKEVIDAVIEMQVAKKEAVANMVEKRHELNSARQEYQLVRINLEQAKKSGDEEAIKAAEEVLKEKQESYKDAKEEYKVAFEEKKELKNDFKKNAKKIDKKKVENNQEETNKVEEDKNDEQVTTQVSSGDVTEQATEAISAQKESIKDGQAISNTEVKKVEEVKKAKEEYKREDEAKKAKIEAVKRAEEIRKETETKLENKENKYEDIKEKDKKIKEEIKEKSNELKKIDNEKKDNRKN